MYVSFGFDVQLKRSFNDGKKKKWSERKKNTYTEFKNLFICAISAAEETSAIFFLNFLHRFFSRCLFLFRSRIFFFFASAGNVLSHLTFFPHSRAFLYHNNQCDCAKVCKEIGRCIQRIWINTVLKLLLNIPLEAF